MTSSGTEAIPFIKIFNNVPISKNINSISLRDDNSVFISADFGLVSLNLITKELTLLSLLKSKSSQHHLLSG